MLTEKRIIHFTVGIPGFETMRKFVFIPEEKVQFARLVFLEESHIGFYILAPVVKANISYIVSM